MEENSVAYTATLLKYIADLTGTPLRTIGEVIGEDGILRLIDNAPMNALLPIEQIAKEVIWDYVLPGVKYHPAMPNKSFGLHAAKQTIASANSKWEYGHCLRNVLTESN